MEKALWLIHRSLSPLKQDCPGTVNGRTLRFVKAPLPTTPHGSAPMVAPGVGQGIPPARETQVVPSSPPVMVRALPVAILTTVLVSHPPATLFTKPLCPSRPGRL